jgi:hypothetical protein
MDSPGLTEKEVLPDLPCVLTAFSEFRDGRVFRSAPVALDPAPSEPVLHPAPDVPAPDALFRDDDWTARQQMLSELLLP